MRHKLMTRRDPLTAAMPPLMISYLMPSSNLEIISRADGPEDFRPEFDGGGYLSLHPYLRSR
jgi:hypothetical protein